MAPIVHIDGNRSVTFEDKALGELIDELKVKNAGALADVTALAHNVAGREFSFKADGEVLDRDKSVPKKAKTLELIEVTVPEAIEEADGQTETVTEVTTQLEVPEGTSDEIAAWVDPGSDGSAERAQAALTAEEAKGDGAHAELVKFLREAIEEADKAGR